MLQLGSEWMDFYEILYLSVFDTVPRIRKFRHISKRIRGTSRDITALNYSQSEKHFKQSCREIPNTSFVFNNYFPKIMLFMR